MFGWLSGGGSRDGSAALSELTGMGFTEEQASLALEMSQGDVGRAVTFLLDQASAAQPATVASAAAPPGAPARSAVDLQNERQLQAAIEASRLESAAPSRDC